VGRFGPSNPHTFIRVKEIKVKILKKDFSLELEFQTLS
jgi:hypothetical protein